VPTMSDLPLKCGHRGMGQEWPRRAKNGPACAPQAKAARGLLNAGGAD
jgi:hypothetical protein